MKGGNVWILLSLLSVALLSQDLLALEVVAPPSQSTEKRFHFEGYWLSQTRQNLILTLGGAGSINANGSVLPASSPTDLETEAKISGFNMKFAYRPFEPQLEFYVLGGLNQFDFRVGSGTHTNSYKTNNSGYRIGGGVRYLLVPRTLMNPSVAFDLSATHSRYRLTKFTAHDGCSSTIDDLMILFELQGALTVSQNFSFQVFSKRMSVDPYIGGRVSRVRTNLDELGTGAHYSGTALNFSPYLGLRWNLTHRIGLIAEGSFKDELSASGGLTVRF